MFKNALAWLIISMATACSGSSGSSSGKTCCADCAGNPVCAVGLLCDRGFECPGPDAGTDASTDSGTDTSTDAGDAGVDAPEEPCCDDCTGNRVCGNGLSCFEGFECPEPLCVGEGEQGCDDANPCCSGLACEVSMCPCAADVPCDCPSFCFTTR